MEKFLSLIKRFRHFIFFALQFFCIFSVFAIEKEQNKTVLVGYFLIDNYQEGLPGQRKSGLGYEYLQKISYYTDWNYVYVYGELTELLQKLKNGEIDMMGDLSYTEERAQDFDYSSFSTGKEEYWIYTLPSRTDIVFGDFSSIQKKKIGTLKDSYQTKLLEEWIKTYNLNIEYVLFDSQEALFKSYYSGTIDAANFASEQVLGDWKPVFYMGASDVYYGVSKRRPDLLKELNEALSNIKQSNQNFNEILEAKYFGPIDSVKKALSEEEKNWLATHIKLRIGCLNDYMPYSNVNKETGQIEGLVTDLMKAITEKLGIETLSIEVVFYDEFPDLFNALHNGKIDAAYPVLTDYFTAETFGDIVCDDISNSIISLLFNSRIEDNSMNRIAAINGSHVWYYASIYYPKSILVPCRNAAECLEALKQNKADCILLNNFLANPLIKNNVTLHNIDMQMPANLSVAIHKGNSALMKLFNRAISLMSEEEVNAAIAKYSVRMYTYSSKDFLRDNITFVIFVVFLLIFALCATTFSLIMYRNALLKAKKANRAKSDFLFNMSHDIRTPMNAIIGFTDKALKHKYSTEVLDDSLKKVKDSGIYLLHIINDILDMAKIESGKLVLQEDIYCMPERALQLTQMLMPSAFEKNITITTDFSDIQDKYIVQDAIRVRQIMTNILTNSIKYTKPGGKIHYEIHQVPCEQSGYGTYVLSVKDNGIGINPEFLNHIFEQFERERTSTISGVQGTGLGMSIVKRLVDAMGGSIDIQSEVNKGTTVTITLTFKIASKTVFSENIQNDIELIDDSDVLLKDKRVLLVEDNKLNREIVKDILEDINLVVEEAEDGDIAVQKVKEAPDNHYDFILMDIQMPRMNGYEATQQIRELKGKNTRNIPIIAITANAFEEDKQAAIKAGMNDHVPKPIILEVLKNTMLKYVS